MVDYYVGTEGLVGTPAAETVLQEVQWAVATGTADAVVAAYLTPVVALTDGLILGVRFALANLTTTPTFAPDGLTPHTITKLGGAALVPGDIAGPLAEGFLRYNLANTRWELLNPAAKTQPFKLLTTDTAGQDVATAQPWFPSAGAVTLAVGTYEFDGYLRMLRSGGATSRTTAVLFGGTATISQIVYLGMAKEGDAADLQDLSVIPSAVSTALVVKAATTSNGENSVIRVHGTVVISGAGTFIPQFQFSAVPGGAFNILKGTYFSLKPKANPQGAWA